MRTTLLLALAALGCKAPCEAPVVLAAADLTVALDALADAYAASGACRPAIAYGSTGAFAAQLSHGGRADLFFAANADFVDRLEREGLVDSDTRTPYAIGRIAVVAPPGRVPPTLEGLSDSAVRYVAIANPEHAPYGMAAEQALRAAGVWDAVAPKLVLGENVAQTWQLVETGNADAGVVALALVRSRAERPYTLVDESLHARILQVAVVPRAAERPAAGRAFLAYVGGPEGRAVLARYGFTLPEG